MLEARVKPPGLVERVLELHDGAQAGCFGHSEADATLYAGHAERLYMLTFRSDGDGSGWGLISVYEPEVEEVGAPVDNDCVAHARFSG